MKTFFKNLELGDRTGKAILEDIDSDHAYMKCDCGKGFSLKLTNTLKNGGNFMCRQCYAERDAANFDSHWGYKAAYSRIKKDARSAERVFEIQLEEFRYLCQQNCYYCGSIPNNLITYRGLNSFTFRYFMYSGLDRINNDIGYTRQNVVPCCIICNRAKNSMPFKDFIDWLNRLTDYRQRMTDEQAKQEQSRE
jgi:hypothetical protein